MLRYAVTNRLHYPGDVGAQTEALVQQAARLANDGVDFLQLREKDLPAHEQVRLALRLRAAVDGSGMKLMLNGPPWLATLAGADGVHLPGDLLARTWRPVDFLRNGRRLLVSAACHTLADVDRCRMFADVLLFSPVFEKSVGEAHVRDGVGLEYLREACLVAGDVPVLALGGVNATNAAECVAVGAAGIAGIRAFL